MTVKNPNAVTRWDFFITAPDGKEAILSSGNLHKLVDTVIQQISVWEGDYPDYAKGAREEAAGLGLTWYEYIKYTAQHQYCLRNNGLETGLCWKNKIGSKILAFTHMIDKVVERSPSLIRKAGETLTQAATLVATGTPQKRMSTCKICGGNRTFQPSQSNLGRAGRLDAPKEK